MFRLGIVIGACIALTGCAGVVKAIDQKAKEVIDARRIPDVQLSIEQIALLKKPADNSRITWHRAGKLADGKIFACYVTLTPSPPTIFGQPRKDAVMVHAGVFEDSNLFKESVIALWGDEHGYHECRDKGIDPPVKKTVTFNGT